MSPDDAQFSDTEYKLLSLIGTDNLKGIANAQEVGLSDDFFSVDVSQYIESTVPAAAYSNRSSSTSTTYLINLCTLNQLFIM